MCTVFKTRTSTAHTLCISMRLSSTNSLLPHLFRVAHHFIRCSLHDTASLGELRGNAHEISVDVAGGLAAFVDAPDHSRVSLISQPRDAVVVVEKTHQTIKDCPRRQSPAANTPLRFVVYCPGGVLIFFLASFSTSVPRSRSSGPKKPMDSSTRSAGKNCSLPSTGFMSHPPVMDFVHSTRLMLMPFTVLPSSSATNSLDITQYSRGSLPMWVFTSV